jgi:DNA-binding transcriptional ArsR family regulator
LGRRARIERVRAAPAGAGTTRLQESSLRAGVLAAVRELGGKGRRAVSVEELAERVGLSAAVVRGHLHKLLEGGHIVCA